MRRACEASLPEAEIQKQIAEGVRLGHFASYEKGREDQRTFSKDLFSEHERLKKSVADFELASGIRINSYDGPKIGEAVRALLSSKDEQARCLMQLQQFKRMIDPITTRVDAAITSLDSLSKA